MLDSYFVSHPWCVRAGKDFSNISKHVTKGGQVIFVEDIDLL